MKSEGIRLDKNQTVVGLGDATGDGRPQAGTQLLARRFIRNKCLRDRGGVRRGTRIADPNFNGPQCVRPALDPNPPGPRADPVQGKED